MKKVSFLIGGLGGGGAERVTIAIADYFCRNGIQVNFIVFSDENQNYDFNKEINVSFLPVNSGKCSILKRLVALKAMLREQDPDYVISLGLGHQYLFLDHLMKKYRFILSERNSPVDFYKHWYERYFNRYCFERAYKVVFQTEDAKAYYNTKIQSKSTIIFNPLTKALPEAYDGKREMRIVFVGRLAPQKNVYMLLDAFSSFHEKFPEYVLEIYGKGEQRDELMAYSEKLQIQDSVRFMGQVSNVYDKMLKAAMYVSSSDFEGMSNSMIEAMALGMPVVCTDCPAGGARMVIDNGENGFLVPIKDADAMCCAMERIAGDPELAQKFSRNARKLREKLSTDVICKQWKDLMD